MRKNKKKKEKKRGMFYSKPRHPWLAKIVTFQSTRDAERAARTLERDFNKAKSREKKREIKGATVLASNRAKAMAKKRDLSERERRKLERISRIYGLAAKKMVMPPKRR